MKTRWQVILISLIVFFIGIVFILLGYNWFQNKMARVGTGTARSTFPYADYSQEELNKLYPQTPAENVATIQTPEETYGKFRVYLKNNDINGALSLVFKRYKSNFEKLFRQSQKDGTVENLYKKLPENITRLNCLDTICIYKLGDTDSEIEFIKSIQGIWLIESL